LEYPEKGVEVMNTTAILLDHDHPLVQSTASQLTSTRTDPLDQLEAIFLFVRDQIKFGFPPKWDQVKASETLGYQLGYCNTKATLFHALCKATGIPSRIHTALIDITIMRGIFPGFAFPFLPDSGGHSWIEVQIDGDWQPIDSYINDQPFYLKAKKLLLESGKLTSFSISEAKGPSSCEFNFGDKGFVHMGAVVVDHGTWEDYSEYIASDKYIPMNRIQFMAYPIISRLSNRRIAKIRSR
jgi:hypothetical protein